ncbi:homeodomain-interacting protein kinase 2-like protein [Lates japonicus]|uniref:Homeodomain-interacting protein kinase 2-like protein n=1 Tax=Lates japonicus TaxID=270547 RepID=A0AAD3M3P4_LATJO|nr:homeodomain-interacting protein kinase 2-like protein [Lates japonicus]
MAVLPEDDLDNSEAEEQLNGEEPSAKPPSDDDSGSDTPHSSGSLISVKVVFDIPDGAEAAAATNGASPDEGPPAKVKRSRMKRIQKFFCRTIRTLFGLKKREEE